MTDPDHIEWVEGLPSRERLYFLWTILLLLIGIVFALLAFYALGVQSGLFPARIWFLSTLPAAPGSVIFAMLTPIGPLMDIFLRPWALRQRPGCVRIGISQRGLAVRALLRIVVFPWVGVRWTDPTHLELRRKSQRVHLALTGGQAAAIVRFFQPPLTSSYPSSATRADD